MGWLSRLFGKKPKQIKHFDGDGDFLLEVVGESSYQREIDQITGGKTAEGHRLECQALLVPEPTNPYDKNAIVVTISGLTVGYLSRPHAQTVGALLKQHRLAAAQADALIVGGWTGRGGRKSEGHYGVRLDIPL